jgi:hypothetical protein
MIEARSLFHRGLYDFHVGAPVAPGSNSTGQTEMPSGLRSIRIRGRTWNRPR